MKDPITDQIIETLKTHIVPGKAPGAARFFKTGPGEYGEGDQFWGITVPAQREVVKQFAALTGEPQWEILTGHPVHEVRLTGWLCVVRAYKKQKGLTRDVAVKFTLKNLDRLNNWDLVDSTAPYILSPEFFEKGDQGILETWARSGQLWLQRVAIMSTFHHIRQGSFSRTLDIADILQDHPHDLIHKAVGWMIREIGNRDLGAEEGWLRPRYKNLPRTLLRYAIEKFPEPLRKAYLTGSI